MAHRLTHTEQIHRREDVAALTALRPVLDELAAVALMPRLGAPCSPRAIFPRCGRDAPGGSELGGSEELRELFANSRSSFSTRASSC